MRPPLVIVCTVAVAIVASVVVGLGSLRGEGPPARDLGAARAVAGGLPDLIVTGMAIELQTGGGCYTSTQLGLRVDFQNAGSADAAPFVIDANGSQQTVAAGLASGAVGSLWFSGAYVYFGDNTVIIDATSLVAESDETNNTHTKGPPVPTLPLPCTPAPPDPALDSDNDGCTDLAENGANPSVGGGRDLSNFWDFFDTPDASNVRDKAISAPDFFRVLARFGASGSASANPLLLPPPAPAYHTAFDRGPASGLDPWDLTAANGSVSSTDFFSNLVQFGHTCANPPCSATTPEPLTTVAYKQVAGFPLNQTSLDIYVPEDLPCGSPVVIWVHGGGYHNGDKANQIDDKVQLFSSNGWVLVSVNYRLTEAGDPLSAHYPDHYEDVADAVAWLHANISDWGGDPSRIALLGHSAGADIVSNVVTNPAYLDGAGLGLDVVTCAGPLDTQGFDKVTADGGDEDTLHWLSALGNNPNYLIETSATTYIQPGIGIPPMIGVVRGSAQRRAIEHGFLKDLIAAGIPATEINAVGLSHAEVNTSIGAPGDTVMTPPLMAFLDGCFQQ